MIYIEDIDTIKYYFKLLINNKLKTSFVTDKFGMNPLSIAI